jgi:FtsH-binding integral membrane protein
MYDLPEQYRVDSTAVAQRGTILGRVLSLLGVAFLCTAGGAFIGQMLGPGAMILSIVGSIGTIFALFFAKEKAPWNLWLMYAFATFVGMSIGIIVERYISAGLGGAVLNAAATTGVVTLVAGGYGYTTKRDLTKLGSILFIGLIAVVVASIAGIFIQLPMFHLVLSVITALLFTGFLVFDLNRVANAKDLTEGGIILLTVSVYLDIINLFLALLRIFGIFGSSDD